MPETMNYFEKKSIFCRFNKLQLVKCMWWCCALFIYLSVPAGWAMLTQSWRADCVRMRWSSGPLPCFCWQRWLYGCSWLNGTSRHPVWWEKGCSPSPGKTRCWCPRNGGDMMRSFLGCDSSWVSDWTFRPYCVDVSLKFCFANSDSQRSRHFIPCYKHESMLWECWASAPSRIGPGTQTSVRVLRGVEWRGKLWDKAPLDLEVQPWCDVVWFVGILITHASRQGKE